MHIKWRELYDWETKHNSIVVSTLSVEDIDSTEFSYDEIVSAIEEAVAEKETSELVQEVEAKILARVTDLLHERSRIDNTLMRIHAKVPKVLIEPIKNPGRNVFEL